MPIVDGYWRADGGASRQEILLRIEQLVDSVVDSLAHGQTPALPLPPAETRLHPVSRLLLHPASGQPRQLKATSRSFADVLSLCCSVYTLLSSRTRRTLRDIFYDGYGAGDADSQRRVDAAARLLCLTLGVHREQLNLLSTPRGFVAGDLVVTTDDAQVDYLPQAPGICSLAPPEPGQYSLRTRGASCAVVVEKEAVFKQLLEDDAPRTLRAIFVTGCGMPDLATRRLVHELHAQLGLPIYLLVDGDPAGLHIMCTYRYGSQVWALSNHKLAVTSARWLGVLPRDCTRFNLPHSSIMSLTAADVAKLQTLVTTYNTPEVHQQVQAMLAAGRKFEIEALNSPTQRSFLASIYLPWKLQHRDWV